MLGECFQFFDWLLIETALKTEVQIIVYKVLLNFFKNESQNVQFNTISAVFQDHSLTQWNYKFLFVSLKNITLFFLFCFRWIKVDLNGNIIDELSTILVETITNLFKYQILKNLEESAREKIEEILSKIHF